MCTGFVIYVVHASSGLFWASRIKSGGGIQWPFDFTQTFDIPSDSNGNARKKIQCAITAVFNNMRTLKFKTEQTIGLFTAVNHLSGPLGNQKFILTN